MERDPDLLTATDAASLMGVSERTVYRLKADAVLPAVRIGTRTYFNRRDVLALLRPVRLPARGRRTA